MTNHKDAHQAKKPNPFFKKLQPWILTVVGGALATFLGTYLISIIGLPGGRNHQEKKEQKPPTITKYYGPVPNVSGTWRHGEYSRYISQSSHELGVIQGSGRYSGIFIGPDRIKVDFKDPLDPECCFGNISFDRKKIEWSNETIWLR